jgi:2-keto-3-deoxy-L-rhamnonate aldolase RhmA
MKDIIKKEPMTVIERLRQGEKIKGTLVRMIRNPAVALIAKTANLDFLLFDMEHGPYSIETVSDIAAVGRAAGVGIFARVPSLDKSYISRSLDAGIEGIMVPMINTAAQAKAFVDLARYTPIGERGLGSNGGLSDYSGMGGKTTPDFMAEQNRKTLTIAQIETAESVENIEEIASVAGIDVLLVGPNDLSISLGIPGDMMHEKMREAVDRVAGAAERHGKFFSVHGGLPLLQKWKGRMQMLMMSMDIEVITKGFTAIENDLSGLR